MIVNIRVPILLRKYDEKIDDLVEDVKFFIVEWNSEKGSLSGDKAAVDYLKWAISENTSDIEPFPMPDGPRKVINVLKYPEDMAFALHSNGIPLPNELLGYCSSWCLSQQYYEHKALDGIVY